MDFGRYNVILGKNGSGKSTLLRNLDQKWTSSNNCVRYITPERGGDLKFDGNMESNRAIHKGWLWDQRRRNRYEHFRQSSVSEFRNLETLALRSIEADERLRASNFTFNSEIERMNRVLDRIRLERADGAGFEVVRLSDDTKVDVSELSSGESELISLATEILSFAYLCRQDKYRASDNWLLFDEPDVHLHPDLQYRLVELLVDSLKSAPGRVVIATHSTTIVSSLCSLAEDVRVGLKLNPDEDPIFRPVSDEMRAMLPVFGAHPLSNIFNENPPLIVEGEDDERIWQSAIRRSEGRIRVHPCVAGDIQSMHKFETAASELMESVYDNAKAYSLRDRDDEEYQIPNVGPVVRMRLNCRSAENLLVTDDALAELNSDWPSIQNELKKWIAENSEHPRYTDVLGFLNSGWDRKNFPLKNIRMLIVGLSGSNKPWEVAVGQAISKLPNRSFSGANSLEHFLGPKLIQSLHLMH